MRKLLTSVLLALSLSAVTAQTTQHYQPTKENIEARSHFQDAKFGIFLH